MKETILSVSGLWKKYGLTTAVSDLSFKVEEGQVYGILGPNGSGKTTTLGVVLGAIIPTKGQFSWFGSGSGHDLRTRIGALLEKPNFYPQLTATQNLQIIADIKNTSYQAIPVKLEQTGLGSWKNKKFGTFSLGMKQRLALASSLLSEPQVLVLDEPTNGLDPQGIADVRQVILDEAQKGTTIILASHLLDEVQKTCTHVAVLKSGKKIFDGAVSSMLKGDQGIEIGSTDMAMLKEKLNLFPGIEALKDEGTQLLIRLKDGYKTSELSSYLITNGVEITHFSDRKDSLEKEFLKLLSANQ